ncbi:MchC protein [Kalamiella sp. sgz302252]|uniref:MchC protein n=1 Tax=Pantoea sp. sgz302252 TaxID=3341827 RepID=UPI0036D378B8
MKNLSLTALTDNLVPFSARQVATSLIWRSPDVDDAETLQNACSYIIDPTSSADTKLFYAERYGGSGLQRNGGGARCGFDGCYQIKGIGINPLVGKGSDRRHSNGALSAEHAIYEALWGEVLAQILPYGAVRTQAVLLITGNAGRAFNDVGDAVPRALLVRKPVIRPAHFERAPWFKPRPEFAAQLQHDARRVKAVIHLLPASLPAPPAGFSKEACRNQRLYCLEGLCELARRLAWQMAFCRTRFLRLTTSPSNVATDGRLLDFNGLNSLFPGDYRDDFGYRLRLQELIKEPAVLQQGLSDLCLYLGKYLFGPAFTPIARQQVEKCFQQTFQEANCRGYLELLGIPAIGLSLATMPQVAQQLAGRFVKLFNSCKGAFYCSPEGSQSDTPLSRLVVALIHTGQGQSAGHSKEWQANPHFAATAQSYRETLHWIKENGPANEIATFPDFQEMERQARQKAQPRSFLRKEQLFGKITTLLADHGDDAPALQQAISAIAAEMQQFAKNTLGSASSCGHSG